jgi:hypothetical protein
MWIWSLKVSYGTFTISLKGSTFLWFLFGIYELLTSLLLHFGAIPR